MKRKDVSTFGQLDLDRVFQTFRVVVFSEFRTKTTRLHTNHRVDLRIEVGGPAKDLRRDLVFLYRQAGMVKGMAGEVTKKLAKGFRAVQDMTLSQPLDLREKVVSFAQPCIPVTRFNGSVTTGASICKSEPYAL